MMKLSVIMPALNEEKTIGALLLEIISRLGSENINFEIIVVKDHGTDNTTALVRELQQSNPCVRIIERRGRGGLGLAIREALDNITGDASVIVTADASDDPVDIVKYFRKLEEGYDCVFGSRFIKGSAVFNYPKNKLFFNRLGNCFIRMLFGIKYNDISILLKLTERMSSMQSGLWFRKISI